MMATSAAKQVSGEMATFAGGCFWGVEKFFKKQFGLALLSTKVGYTGGNYSDPSYEAVCSASTGHAEALQVVFDPKKATYKDLLTYFWRMHDPTTVNRQANDKGTQYRSAVFYHSEEQKKIALQVKEQVKSKFKSPIVTEITPASAFFDAEKYHQSYLEKNPGGYCSHKLQW